MSASRAGRPGTIRRRPHDRPADAPDDPRFTAGVVYLGNQCNRACFFCCVDGSPEGRYSPVSADEAERVLTLLRPDARIKLYGGEPTLWKDDVVGLIGALRQAGYRGRLTVFSNGIQSDRLIEILESDPPCAEHAGTDSYLNTQIWWGAGVEPIPEGRRRVLERYAAGNPGRVWLSHADVLPVGAAREHPTALDALAAPRFDDRCARCEPTLRGDGIVHACAFAVEEPAERYRLGRLGDAPADIRTARERFLGWIEHTLEPAARAEGVAPCDLCIRFTRAETEGTSWALDSGVVGNGVPLPMV